MDRSSAFGSTLSNCTPYSDPLSLRLPYTVKLATERKSLTHYTKGTRSRLRAPTVFMHAVSGSISLPSRGSFRLSLSVGHEYLALEDGPPIFRQDITCPALLFVFLVPHTSFHIPGSHLLWPDFPVRSAHPCVKEYRLFPFRSPLLWESRLISVPAVTKMFQFTAFASLDL